VTAPFEWGAHVLRPVTPPELFLLRRQGVNRVTVPLPWRWTEPQPGNWQMAPLDHFLAPLRAAKLPLQGALGPAMPHALPDHALAVDGPGFVASFASSCAEIARRTPDIAVFRVEAELNAAPWWERLVTRRRRGAIWRDPGFRSALLRTAVDAVRAARPDAEIRVTVHASLPGWRGELQRWIRDGLRFDRLGLTLQPCFFLPDPDLAARCGEAVEQAIALLRHAYPQSPPSVEIARTAYPTRGPRFTPRRQRAYFERAAEAVQGSGGGGLHWWALRDQAHDDPVLGYWTPAQERHYGLLYYDGVAKPAADALRVLATGDRFGEGSLAG
jgi:hypothetical protein